MIIPEFAAIGVIETIGAVGKTLAKRRDKREKEFERALEDAIWHAKLANYSQPEQISCFDVDSKTTVCVIKKRIPDE